MCELLHARRGRRLLQGGGGGFKKLEAASLGPRKAKPGASDRYQRLARTHRQSVGLCATLATRLRHTPSAKLDKRTPTDGELPVN